MSDTIKTAACVVCGRDMGGLIGPWPGNEPTCVWCYVKHRCAKPGCEDLRVLSGDGKLCARHEEADDGAPWPIVRITTSRSGTLAGVWINGRHVPNAEVLSIDLKTGRIAVTFEAKVVME